MKPLDCRKVKCVLGYCKPEHILCIRTRKIFLVCLLILDLVLVVSGRIPAATATSIAIIATALLGLL